MYDYSPVVLFVYNRPLHTLETINALAKNTLATSTDLYIYSDAANSESELKNVESVRAIIRNVSGFNSVTVVEQDTNKGLAESIISGVSSVVKEYGKVIVLEDDIVTGKYFLQYMNDSLQFYKENKDVYNISACNYPVKLDDVESDTYFLRIPLCWGWATWKDRWSSFERNLDVIDKLETNLINYINFDGAHDFFIQAIRNKKGELKTWFIFWYINLALRKKLTLFPKYSLVKNIGHDGSGENCGKSANYDSGLYNNRIKVDLISVQESFSALEAHKKYFLSMKPSFLKIFLNKIKKKVKVVYCK